MKNPIEECLADIESNITRLTKMQDCVFNMLLILHKVVKLFEMHEAAFDSAKVSMESAHRGMDRSLVFMFGAFGVLGFVTSMFFVSSATEHLTNIVLLILMDIIALVVFFYGFSQFRRARSELQEIMRKWTQTSEVLEGAREDEKAANDTLAQLLAEWKELVPDDLVGEPKSED